MELEDVQEVVVDTEVISSFIVAYVSKGDAQKTVVRARQNCVTHPQILEELRREVAGLYVFCVGGGRIGVSRSDKKIDIWGSSGTFGFESGAEGRIRTKSVVRD